MGHKKTAVLVGIVVLVVLAAVYYFYYMPSRPAGSGENTGLENTETAQSPAPPEQITPIDVDLNASDAIVRKLAEKLSSYPLLARWLATDDILRRFAAAVDLIAKGDSPRRPMNFIDVTGAFKTLELDGKTYIDPASYRRYDRIAGAIASLDAKGCATLYKQLRQPIQQAYREMGYPEGDFDATLKTAFSYLLETPIVEGTIYLEKDVLTYKMTDPELENLSAAQKHLLRMGPENMRAVQEKLREIEQYLGY